MKNILWIRIILTGLGMEIIYGIYISFIRWYEESLMTSFIALAILMFIGGYWVAKKTLSNKILQGALVGVVGVIFYLIVSILLADGEDVSTGLQFWMEHLAKIGGGALGGFFAKKRTTGIN
ncbi:TIGR04086 family membrane protein [Algoriphagus sp.]|uniref:TIGR04086 family membrane protein n=1 Tax=Algoriphagus sp. TaxID=1872435 RepID=UPI0025F9FD29|nr:TIGR04086 family membrane protein [Algoriphagus sp.]